MIVKKIFLNQYNLTVAILSKPWGFNTKPTDIEFHNSGVELHGHHNHAFS